MDLTWSSPAAAGLLEEWRVLDGEETLSDHNYIEMIVHGEHPDSDRGRIPKRWALNKLDEDLLTAALLVETWGRSYAEDTPYDIEATVNRVRGSLTRACDCAAPRSRPRPKRAAH